MDTEDVQKIAALVLLKVKAITVRKELHKVRAADFTPVVGSCWVRCDSIIGGEPTNVRRLDRHPFSLPQAQSVYLRRYNSKGITPIGFQCWASV